MVQVVGARDNQAIEMSELSSRKLLNVLRGIQRPVKRHPVVATVVSQLAGFTNVLHSSTLPAIGAIAA